MRSKYYITKRTHIHTYVKYLRIRPVTLHSPSPQTFYCKHFDLEGHTAFRSNCHRRFLIVVWSRRLLSGRPSVAIAECEFALKLGFVCPPYNPWASLLTVVPQNNREGYRKAIAAQLQINHTWQLLVFTHSRLLQQSSDQKEFCEPGSKV